jgi:prolyl-tRNA synthetase
MYLSKLFTKTSKDSTSDAHSKNADLLIKAGYIAKTMAGVYSYLPLGLKVIRNIERIVREEMDNLGAQELLMSSMQNKEVWEQTDRWNDDIVDVWFKAPLHAGGEIGFGWSHEEPIGEMMKQHINSYKDLPIFVYQFQNKMRNELRAKSGVMRGREFIMKDMYSFCTNEEEHEQFYQATIQAYLNVYKRAGVGDDTFVTFADGGAFTEFSHEFQTICDAGEDIIYINREKNIAINEEVLNEKTLTNLGVTRDELEEVKTAETGNIFNFGTQKAEDLNLSYINKENNHIPVFIGSYGIGVSRLMGVLVEKYADDKGLVWPEAVAPFKVHIVPIAKEGEVAYKAATELYEELKTKGIAAIFDDRVDMRVGQRLGDADLLGTPWRIVIGQKSLDNGGFEVKRRNAEEAEVISKEALLQKLV